MRSARKWEDRLVRGARSGTNAASHHIKERYEFRAAGIIDAVLILHDGWIDRY